GQQGLFLRAVDKDGNEIAGPDLPAWSRSRAAVLNGALLDPERLESSLAAAETLPLDFFEDASWTAVRTDLERGFGGSLVWRGYLKGLPNGSTVALVYRDGSLSGSAWLPGHTYELRARSKG